MCSVVKYIRNTFSMSVPVLTYNRVIIEYFAYIPLYYSIYLYMFYRITV